MLFANLVDIDCVVYSTVLHSYKGPTCRIQKYLILVMLLGTFTSERHFVKTRFIGLKGLYNGYFHKNLKFEFFNDHYSSFIVLGQIGNVYFGTDFLLKRKMFWRVKMCVEISFSGNETDNLI